MITVGADRVNNPMRGSLTSRVRESVAALLLLAAQLALATSIHHHSSNIFEGADPDESASPREVHEIDCSQPTASHWHRDRVVEVDPCLACLRQHLVAPLFASPSPHTAPASPAPLPVAGVVVLPSAVDGIDCRGPPHAVLTRTV